MKIFQKKVVLYLCTIVSFISANKITAQDTSSTQGLLQYIFKNIDKAQVPTGILAEYGCPIVPMATFNGALTDSNMVDMNLWRTLYFQLQTGYCQASTNPFAPITSVNAAIQQSTAGSLPTAIPLLMGSYASVKPNAITANLLRYAQAQNQLWDVAGRPQSPYQTNSLFAACPSFNRTTSGTASFVYNPSLVWNNTGKAISQLQIDFGNGQGWQTLAANTPISVSYADTGTKHWTIKATLTDNSSLQCYAEYEVMNIQPATNAALKPAGVGGGAVVQNYQPPATTAIFVDPTANHSGGSIRIVYTRKNPTKTLRKPLIVIEGYDVSAIAPDIQDSYGYVDFIGALAEAKTSTWDFNHQLDDVAGYDLVFVTYKNGTDDIRSNAALVQDVITRVNALKVPNGNNGNLMEQNVVMGLSMSGLCARYALAQMTKANLPTQTRLLITHDSPHHGANVPLGLQYFIQMMGGFKLFGYTVTDIYPQYNEAVNLLNAPATQQLLVYRATTANNFVTNTFLDGDYRNMVTFAPNGPQPTYRFIATSLGNECGHPLFAPGKTFLNLGAGVGAGITAGFFLFRLPIITYKLAAEAEAYALPSSGVAKIARLYTINNLKLFGLINIFKQLYNNTAYSSGTQLPIDGVPGSTSFPSFNRINLSLQFNLGWIFGGYFNAYAYNQGVSPSFTFVSTVSALDVAPVTTSAFADKYVNGTNQGFPSTSATYVAQETNTAGTSNNVHIRFTARNANWMFNEMENLPNTLNCSSECSNAYYIKGDSYFCTNGIYSVPGLSGNTNITWSASPSIVSFAPGNTPQTTVSKQSDGNTTLTANIITCSGGSATLTKSVSVGNAVSGTYNVNSNYVVSNNNTMDYDGGSVMQPASQSVLFSMQINNTNLSNYSWSVSGTYNSYNTTNGNWLNLWMTTPANAWAANNATVTLNATGPCGAVSKNYNFQALSTGAGHFSKISPNPVNNSLNVAQLEGVALLDATNNSTNAIKATNSTMANTAKAGMTAMGEASAKAAPIKPVGISLVRIFDMAGRLRKTIVATEANQLQVDVSSLSSGVYLVEVTSGINTEKHKIIVQH